MVGQKARTGLSRPNSSKGWKIPDRVGEWTNEETASVLSNVTLVLALLPKLNGILGIPVFSVSSYGYLALHEICEEPLTGRP